MRTRKLRELKVSGIGMGCMGFSHGYGTAPDCDYSIEAMRDAFSYGCTFFDTAETYGTQQFYPGHNEQLVGEAVDLYYLHRVNEDVPLEEVAGVMGNLIQEGIIRAWGLSQVSAEMLRPYGSGHFCLCRSEHLLYGGAQL